MPNLISTEIILASIAFAVGGFSAWNDVTNKLSANTAKDEARQEQAQQQYRDLKNDTSEIRRLLEQALKEQHGHNGN